MARRDVDEFQGLLLIEPRRIGDDRGFFSETYHRGRLAELGFHADFVQDNHAWSREAGVLRGLHFQSPPFAQDKLVRVTRGAILDVAVDLRRGAPTYGDHAAVELSAANWRQLLVPVGFAHGYLTLAPDTEVVYKVTAHYAPAHDAGLLWSDPDIGVDWGRDPGTLILSDKDRRAPTFSGWTSPFALEAVA